MYAVALPNTPLFAEHFNPDLKIIELIGCPDSGDILESEYSFANYFHDMKISDRQEIMEAFDKDGYYETFEDIRTGFDGPKHRYLITLFPKTDNAMIDDSTEAIAESMHDFCSLVAANARAEGDLL